MAMTAHVIRMRRKMADRRLVLNGAVLDLGKGAVSENAVSRVRHRDRALEYWHRRFIAVSVTLHQEMKALLLLLIFL